MAGADIEILRAIAQVVEIEERVPDAVQVDKQKYQIAYLEDHRQRLEDALRRHDKNLLGILFGQLSSKIRYQAVAGRVRLPRSPAKKAVKKVVLATAKKAKTTATTTKTATVSKVTPVKKAAAKKVATKKATAKKATAKKATPTTKKATAKATPASKTTKATPRTAAKKTTKV